MSTPPPPPPPTPPASKSRFAPYRQALQAISARTGTALPTLIVSFGLVHELTALVPLCGFFFGARALGVGDRVVQAVAAPTEGEPGWAREKARGWLDDGGRWAQRVGHRYGVFGYEKRERGKEGEEIKDANEPTQGEAATRIAGDAANAIVAYGLTKATMPLRLALSMYLAPGFARGVVDPIRRRVMSLFRRKSS
ncbi:hypothetical protein PsYK624_108030 [Phanerochaete sordida]|uniref:DUF1279 domain-containing protein n=1 Tax=Phanerochaete sordida TaxID=48140 RepID=A0A9P3LHY7_9APHY|nr:hypothetical protein PsYK624_108030 [Phanerochaete sordida]